MTLLDGLRRLAEERALLVEDGVDPFGVPVEAVFSPTEARMAGRSVILAGSNNYLGLTSDPACLQAAHRALDEEGTGTTGSRMASGSFAGHGALERELADFYGVRSAVLFSAGYLANLGTLSALAGPGDYIVLDADCHASIYEGCRLSGAEVLRFRHNDPDSLGRRLARLGESAGRALVVVEGIYSMLGDRAPLAELVEVKREHGALLLVDEAHSLGVLGEGGRGLAEECGVQGDVDFIVGTFSKSLGGVGGFCVSDHPELDMVRYTSRAYIFTASSSPPVIAGVRAALKEIRARPELRERLWENCTRLYRGLEALGYVLGPEVSPVVAVTFESVDEALDAWRRLLLEEGVYVNLMLPPATPGGKPLLRCSASAAHTADQIDRIVEGFRKVSPVRAA